MTGVLVLNAGYEPLQRVSLAHAVRMLHRQVAVVEEAVDGRTFGPYPLPRVLRLVRYVQMRWRNRRGIPMWSRSGMLERDGHVCAYCGTRGATTVDHVLPRSRGGASSWLNTVAACLDCNHRKRDRTPQEAGMGLRFEPHVPTHRDLLAR
ncbi:HNH endonuclease [Cellulomonas sp. URHD0024]|uniref:HNH endonuclease n=1 Tax=Cellulomonas sp. URHD0024 TaxID=1302620 RepID=UPI00040AC904|nr:HNH endonuclease [Cellulomonas sp. URHD0024]